MTDKQKENQKYDVPVKFAIGFWLVVIVLTLVTINYMTVEEVKVPASCEIVMSDLYDMPDNVITKGYDVIRTDVMDIFGEVSEEITYDCYYIKNAGLIEKIYRGWENYR